MLMRKLVLENFRQYIGEQTIVFSEDPKKNVTLIRGINTSGKTTLIQAFRWVLYNDCNFTGKRNDPKSVMNNDVRKMMRVGDVKEVKVTLLFIHKDILYEISRKYIYKCKISGDGYLDTEAAATVYYYPNGEKEPVKGGEAVLDRILPRSLSEYFFFDGEKIAESRNPDKVKDSINNIMGLVPLEHMAKHLFDGRNNVYLDLGKRIKSDSTNDINNKIARENSRLEDSKANKEDAHKRFQEASDRAENLRAEIEEIKDLAGYAAELKSVESKIKDREEKLESDESDIMRSFSDAMYEAMENFVASDIFSNISTTEYEDKGIPGMNASSIHYLLDHGRCICGTDLTKSEDCRKELLNLLGYLPPESIGTQISNLTKELKTVKDAHGKQDVFKYNVQIYEKDLELYEELNNRQCDISSKVSDHKDADVIMANYQNAKSRRDEFHNLEVKYQSAINESDKLIAGYQKELDGLARTNSFNQEILFKRKYAKSLYDKAKSEYESNSAGIFEDVQKTLTEVFNSMYHGQRAIELTPDYKVRLMVGGDNLDKSKGLDTVQNFAFIASLLKVAKERSKTELGSEPYPLAMDAVFSNTDDIHIRNICKELPRLAEQAILALMDRDWKVAEPSLREYVGKRYRINKISETQSEIVEESGDE